MHAPAATYRHAWPTLALLAVILAAGNCMLGSFSTVQEAAKAELALTDTQLGLLQGLAMSLPLAALSIPAGLAVDRGNRVRLLFATSLAWTAGTLLTAFAASLPLLFLARMLTGIGASISTTIAISMAADLCRPEARGRSLLLLTIGKYAGSALAFALSGALLGLFELKGTSSGLSAWRTVHLALGLGSLVLTAATWLLREPARQETTAAHNAPVADVMRALWTYRGFLVPLFLGQVGVMMADAAAVIWTAPVLSRSYGLTPADFAGWMGAVVLGSGVLGALLGGFAADFGHRSSRRGGILIGAALASALALPAALFPLAPNPTVFAWALFVLLLGGTVTGLVTATAMAVLLPNELRGLCVSAFLAFGGLVAFGGGPTLVTAISALRGGESELAPALALVGLCVSATGLFGFVAAMRTAPKPV